MRMCRFVPVLCQGAEKQATNAPLTVFNLPVQPCDLDIPGPQESRLQLTNSDLKTVQEEAPESEMMLSATGIEDALSHKSMLETQHLLHV